MQGQNNQNKQSRNGNSNHNGKHKKQFSLQVNSQRQPETTNILKSKNNSALVDYHQNTKDLLKGQNQKIVNFDLSKSQILDYSFGDNNISSIISKTNNISDEQHYEQTARFRVASRQINDFETPMKSKKYKKRKNRSLSEKNSKRSIKRTVIREDKEKVIYEGELLKICPGVSRQVMNANRDLNGGTQYVERWCQITENRFRYYKNKICAYSQPEKPLMSVPIKEIIESSDGEGILITKQKV